MALLIGLLIVFGCFVVGGYVGSGAVTVIALVFTAPGFIYEKVFPDKKVSKAGMFLVDLAFWSVVFGILYLSGKLTVLNVTVGIVVSLVIGIIGAFAYYFFGFDEPKPMPRSPDKNCSCCGAPFVGPDWGYASLCPACQNQYVRAVEEEIRKMPQKQRCDFCAGSGKIKGYNCVKCKGSGSVASSDLETKAISILSSSSKWSKSVCRYKEVDHWPSA